MCDQTSGHLKAHAISFLILKSSPPFYSLLLSILRKMEITVAEKSKTKSYRMMDTIFPPTPDFDLDYSIKISGKHISPFRSAIKSPCVF